ncbi:hypothetical protein ABZV22_45300 [Streptosporangium canum]
MLHLEGARARLAALAAEMIADALDAGLTARWVNGDEVYGQDPRLRALPEHRRIGYVLAIAGNRRVNLEGIDRSVAAGVADRHWHRYRAGQGAKCPRWYAWVRARIDEAEPEGYLWLLILRNRGRINPIADWVWSREQAHPVLVSLDEWHETQLMTAQMQQRQAPGWDRVNAAAAQHGIQLTTVREIDTHVLYEAAGRQLVLPCGDLPTAVADEVIIILEAGA